MAALELPGEEVALPDVRPAVSPTALAGAALETEVLALLVGLRGGRVTDQTAEIDEPLLRALALAQAGVASLLDELVRSHAGGGYRNRTGGHAMRDYNSWCHE